MKLGKRGVTLDVDEEVRPQWPQLDGTNQWDNLCTPRQALIWVNPFCDVPPGCYLGRWLGSRLI